MFPCLADTRTPQKDRLKATAEHWRSIRRDLVDIVAERDIDASVHRESRLVTNIKQDFNK